MTTEVTGRRAVTVWKWLSLLVLPAAFGLSVWSAAAPPEATSRRAERTAQRAQAFEIVARGFPTGVPTSTATHTPTTTPTNTATNTPTNTATNTPTSTATATIVVAPPAPAIPTVSGVGAVLMALLLMGVAVAYLIRTRP
jgi:hypothetical protein